MFDTDTFKSKRGFLKPYVNSQDTVIIINHPSTAHKSLDKYNYYLTPSSAQALLNSERIQKAENWDAFCWWARHALGLMFVAMIVGFTATVFITSLTQGLGMWDSLTYALSGGFNFLFVAGILALPLCALGYAFLGSRGRSHRFVHRALMSDSQTKWINERRDFPFTSSLPSANTAMQKTINGITPEGRDWVFQQSSPDHGKAILCQELDQFTYKRITSPMSASVPFDKDNPPESLASIHPSEAGWLRGAIASTGKLSHRNDRSVDPQSGTTHTP